MQFCLRSQLCGLVVGSVGSMASSPAFAVPRMGKAPVEVRSGVPCFRINDKAWVPEGAYKLQGISVVGPALTEWAEPPRCSGETWE